MRRILTNSYILCNNVTSSAVLQFKKIKNQPRKIQEMKVNRNQGFTALEIMIVVAILVLLGTILTMEYSKVRRDSQRMDCAVNLKQINGAKDNWAMENRKESRSEPTGRDLYGPTAYIKTEPKCPSGGVYTLGMVSELPRCSYHADIEIK